MGTVITEKRHGNGRLVSSTANHTAHLVPINSNLSFFSQHFAALPFCRCASLCSAFEACVCRLSLCSDRHLLSSPTLCLEGLYAWAFSFLKQISGSIEKGLCHREMTEFVYDDGQHVVAGSCMVGNKTVTYRGGLWDGERDRDLPRSRLRERLRAESEVYSDIMMGGVIPFRLSSCTARSLKAGR